ncbi:glyoxylate/hydroxypyruvate reductase A [Chishuiella changwenlii]|uniref:2-hydroxyacid dehydrogenase n=1 Tax=Chishuiella changwenlii TaxID=1434701 RepID=UPI002FDAC8E9
MSIAIIFNNRKIEDWQEKLSAQFTDTKVEVYPEISNPEDVEFIIAWKPHKGYINEFPNAKVIQSAGAGIDHLLHTKLPEHVKVTRIVDEELKQDMFEHVLACIMISMKNMYKYSESQENKEWKPVNYQSIKDITITVLGLGKIGQFVAEKFVNLGFKVQGWSNSEKQIEGVKSFSGELELAEAANGIDFIVNILPLTNETKGILNKNLFDKFSENTVLINVGRGAHLVDEDLTDALQSNQIKEAYLDVFNEEPLPVDHPFWENDKVFMTPHVASITNTSSVLLQIEDNYYKMKQKADLTNEVSLEKGY